MADAATKTIKLLDDVEDSNLWWGDDAKVEPTPVADSKYVCLGKSLRKMKAKGKRLLGEHRVDRFYAGGTYTVLADQADALIALRKATLVKEPAKTAAP